jgi:hypothetical protein
MAHRLPQALGGCSIQPLSRSQVLIAPSHVVIHDSSFRSLKLKMRYIFRATLAFAFGAVLASAATLTQVQNFGANPSGIQMHLYVPDKVATNPGLIVAVSISLTALNQSFFIVDPDSS